MPVHDWSRADDGLFHNFHVLWQAHLCEALNAGLLPSGYYAMIEAHAGLYVPDLTTLAPAAGDVPTGGGVAVAEPAADRKVRYLVEPRPRRRIAVRGPRRVVAVVEIVSRGNKDRDAEVSQFVAKAVDLLAGGINLAVIDSLPPGPHDLGGMHPEISRALDPVTPADPPLPGRPLTFASYHADVRVPPVAYLNYAAVGQRLPDVPLYLHGDAYVTLPLEATYMTGYNRLPGELRALLG